VITVSDARATADHARMRLEVLAERLEELVSDLRVEIDRLDGRDEPPAQNEGGGDDDRGDGDGASQVG